MLYYYNVRNCSFKSIKVQKFMFTFQHTYRLREINFQVGDYVAQPNIQFCVNLFRLIFENYVCLNENILYDWIHGVIYHKDTTRGTKI